MCELAWNAHPRERRFGMLEPRGCFVHTLEPDQDLGEYQLRPRHLPLRIERDETREGELQGVTRGRKLAPTSEQVTLESGGV